MESRNKFVLIVLSIISIILIGITSFNDSIISPLRQAVGIVLLPVQSGVNTAGRAVYDNIEEQRKIHSAITENIELNKKIDELTQENTKLMAAGAFVGGSSIELSADGPMKEPYSVFFQGGLTWYHAKLGIMLSLQKIYDAGLIQ